MTHFIESFNRVIKWCTCTRLSWKGITCHTLLKEAKKAVLIGFQPCGRYSDVCIREEN